eukprot:Em0015g382a
MAASLCVFQEVVARHTGLNAVFTAVLIPCIGHVEASQYVFPAVVPCTGPMAAQYAFPAVVPCTGPMAAQYVFPAVVPCTGPMAAQYVFPAVVPCTGPMAAQYVFPAVVPCTGPMAAQYVFPVMVPCTGPMAAQYVFPAVVAHHTRQEDRSELVPSHLSSRSVSGNRHSIERGNTSEGRQQLVTGALLPSTVEK